MLKKSLPLITRRSGSLFGEYKARNLYLPPNQRLDLRNKISLSVERAANVNSVFLDFRNYSKGRDIKKDKKKKIRIDENELSEFFDVQKLYTDISKPLDHYKQELIEHTSLRSSQGAIENLKIQFEGETYTIQDLAEFGKKNPKLYVLDLSAFPQTIPSVMTALQASDLNLNVQQQGTRVYVPIPKVTREHRELLSKKARVYFLKCKEKVKNVQRKYLNNLKNIESLSDDMRFNITEQINALGEKQIQVAQEILKAKSDELLKAD